MGIDKEGNKKDSFEPGIELLGKVTVFAEGCRGHLGKQLIKNFELDKGKDPQQYGIGFKEIWEIDEKNHEEAMVYHSFFVIFLIYFPNFFKTNAILLRISAFI